jgi:hypothetical protein
MTEAEKTALAIKILDIMLGARFEKWYENEFMDYVTGENLEITRDQIIEKIIHIFQL